MADLPAEVPLCPVDPYGFHPGLPALVLNWGMVGMEARGLSRCPVHPSSQSPLFSALLMGVLPR